MDRLAPHGGCNWQGCTECFPERSKAWQSTTATLSTPDWPSVRVSVVEWSTPHEAPIPGYAKVENMYGFVMVVESSRLTDWRTY